MTTHPFRESFYRSLPGAFYAPAEPFPAPAPAWAMFNSTLAEQLGLGPDAATPELLQLLAGGKPPAGRENIALAYAGHQFGQWNPRMGDGRAALVGEIHAPDGTPYDVHLKGSGPTIFARRGDGRATLPAMLREYIVSEAFAGLNIPATRSLAVVLTGADVYRDRVQAGAVLTRIARTHVRIGTFQYAAAQDGAKEAGPILLKSLLDACIARHYPAAGAAENPALAFFAAIVAGQARLIAQWMLVGFIHGVMNTDNMSIACETIDFGPCAFMDGFKARKVFSSIDEMGRYAYNRQPGIAGWNLARLAEALLPLFAASDDDGIRLAQSELNQFQPIYTQALAQGLERKLGLRPDDAANGDTIARMWDLLEQSGADFTLFFRRLTQVAGGQPGEGTSLEPFYDLFGAARAQGEAFLAHWRSQTTGDDFAPRLTQMRASNPIVIARNHRVEQALESATEGDFGPAQRLCGALKNPFAEPAEGMEDLEKPPLPQEEVQQTYCGT